MISESIVGFLIASFLLGLSPGPDNLFVLTQSALYGARKGIYITLGLCTGLIVHTLLVATGVAAFVSSASFGLILLQIAGVIYLLYLAWLSYRDSLPIPLNADNPRFTASALYRRGILMNVSNPKVSIFFLAFLPQFVTVDRGNMMVQLLVLGMLFIVTTVVVFFSIALLAGRLGIWFQKSNKAQTFLKRTTAMVLCGLAVHLAMLNTLPMSG